MIENLVALGPSFILLGIIGWFIWYLKIKSIDKLWSAPLSNTNLTYKILIGWLIFGFLANLDFYQDMGCLLHDVPIFSEDNIYYSGSAILLLSLIYFSPLKKQRALFLTIELLFCLHKLFLIKGGYSCGFGGVPSIDVVTFDTIALILRIRLIYQISEIKGKSTFVLMIPFFVVFIKLLFFR